MDARQRIISCTQTRTRGGHRRAGVLFGPSHALSRLNHDCLRAHVSSAAHDLIGPTLAAEADAKMAPYGNVETSLLDRNSDNASGENRSGAGLGVSTIAGFIVSLIVGVFPLTASAADLVPQLVITGGNTEQQNNIRAQANLDRRSCELPEFREQALQRDVTDRAERALRALGHYNPTITTDIVRIPGNGSAPRRDLDTSSVPASGDAARSDGTPSDDTTSGSDGCYRVELEFDPGPVTRIAEIELTFQSSPATTRSAPATSDDGDPPADSGNANPASQAGFVADPAREVPALAAFLADPGIATGDALRHDAYDALRSRMQRVAQEQGFLSGRWITRRLLVDPEVNEARVELVYDVGPRYRFGAVDIQQDILRESFVDRFIPFEPGEIYATRGLLRLQRNLDASGYFASARVRPNLDAADDEFQVPIDVEVVPRKRWAFEAGVGFSTDVGPRLRGSVENRYVNRRGHRAQADLELSQRRSGVSTRYLIPLADPLTERLEFNASLRREDTDTQTSDRAQLGASRIRTRSSGWTVSEGLRYERERFTIAGETRTTNFLIPSYQLNRTQADDDLFPQRGHRINLLAQGAAKSIGSSADFVQGVARGKMIAPLGSGRLIARTDLALTFTDRVEDLPSSLRFFAGGDTSIRGFGFERLGPTNADGRVIGGRHLIVGSAEYEHPVGRAFGAAVFTDVGNAFNEFDDVDPRVGIGVGARWRSPVGPIRFDVAHGIDGSEPFRIHFTMGPDL